MKLLTIATICALCACLAGCNGTLSQFKPPQNILQGKICLGGYCIAPEVAIPVTAPAPEPAPVAVNTYLAPAPPPAPKIYDPLPDIPDTVKQLAK